MDELFKAAKLKNEDIFKLVVMPDTHVPEDDKGAVSAFLQFLKWYRPHGLVILGDFLEMESVSHWDPKSAKPRRLVPDVKAAKALLKKIDLSAGPQCLFRRFIIGNHEVWQDSYLIEKVPEFYDGIEELGVSLRIQDLLGLKDFGFRVIPFNEILQVGELHLIHGIFTNTHHAKKHLDTYGVNLCYGHTHDTQQHIGVNVRSVYEAFSTGCLRTLDAAFLKGRPSNWVHAFGVVEFQKNGHYTKTVPHIINGVLSYGAKVFSGVQD
jgi:hypothetical protein